MKRIFLLACLCLAMSGCNGKGPHQRPPWPGPGLPMWEVVQKINANAGRINTVWARHDFEATIYDDKGKSHALSGSGVLQFRKPGDLLLKAGGVIDYFEAGANDRFYWFTVYPKEVSTQWWGRKELFTEEAAERIPIRPDLLLEVLGVQQISEEFMQPPAPVMRVNNDAWAYMFTFQAPAAAPARWIALKEVWYDVQSFHPTLILLFDEHGRVILRAYLNDYQKLEGIDAEMATRYDLYFPQNKSHMRFHLTILKPWLDKGRLRFPNDATFEFPEDPGVEKRVEIR